ncbi:uncharacterized protein LOC130640840 [Hydractinia symbiolongicarpus]|uniref:uncharacterized protein LOC130640840 n=1 Tax=Hydractinia symbiolongicarpus TaxID=13093 RepID=UPI002550E7BD|nr:uncharacterized protein LOC130640840 [Hydractinia symbiolongicarpus]
MSYIRKLAKLQEKEAQQRAAEKEKTSDETPSNSSREQSPQPTDFQQESSLGSLDYEAVTDATENVKSSGKKSYNRWSEKERFDIGKYVAIHGGAAAITKFQTKDRPLSESTARRFGNLYKKELKDSTREKRSVVTKFVPLKRGRPLFLGSLDEMVQRFLIALRNRGGVVSRTVATAAAKALISRNPQFELGHIKIDNSWAKSLFKRMGFKKRMKTTSKVEITEGAKKECELLFLHDIVSTIEQHSIPHQLVMNLDQTALKFVPRMNHTMAKKGSSSVPIVGSSDKRCLTGTFIITLDGSFLPMQLIYGGKTNQSLPKFEFPESFSLSVNPKHYSNTQESIKVIKEIVLKHVEDQRKKLNNPKQAALLIFDVFRGQITEEVTELLKKNNIFLVLVPSNMTHIFQPLDLTVNNHCKQFMRNLFTEWYSKQIEKELSLNKKIEDINIQLKLTTIKPLHASWLLQFYNHITSADGREVVLNGWKASGIYDAVRMGSTSLESLDPFQDLSPLPESNSVITQPITDIINAPDLLKDSFINVRVENDDDKEEEYTRDEDDIDFSRNAFDIIIDDEEE